MLLLLQNMWALPQQAHGRLVLHTHTRRGSREAQGGPERSRSGASLMPGLEMEEVSPWSSDEELSWLRSALKYLIPIYLKFCQSVYTIYIKNTGSGGS